MRNNKYRISGIFLILFIFFISLSCISKGYSTNERDEKNRRTKTASVEIESQKKYDLRKLTFEDILADTNIFNDLYTLHSQKHFSIDDKKIELELYNIKKEELIYYDDIPSSIIVVKSDNNETKLPIGSYHPLDEISYIIPKTNKPVLCIQNPLGGNGWNSNRFYVISLEDRYFLKNIGEISRVYDVDNDGIDELIEYDDIWELGLDYLCHADAPGARIILSIEKDKIVFDINNNSNYYQDEIKRINAEIKIFPKEIYRYGGHELLSLILQKFLIYRLLGNIEKGWDEFDKDIRHYNEKFFYMYDEYRKRGLDKIFIEEIKDKMNKSLKRTKK